MSDIANRLSAVVTNLTRNLTHVETNINTATKAVSQLDDESKASIEQLLTKWEHPQAIAQFVTAVAQLKGLTDAKAEMQAAVALLQVGTTDEDFLTAAQQQLDANVAGAKSPLSAAGQSAATDPLAPANETQNPAAPAV
jgi:ABC-type phosphate transport system ATPase subunit